MAWQWSSEAAALLQTTHQIAVKCEVWNGSTVLCELPVDPQGSSVVEDETATIRWTLTLVVDPDADVPVPANVGDLLHPLSGNELHPYRGVVLSDGTVEWCPLGVYRITSPDTTAAPGNTTVKVTGIDRLGEISTSGWTGAFTTAAGLTVDQAIEAILVDRWGGRSPALTFNLAPQTAVVPAGTVFGITYSSSGFSNQPGSQSQNNPVADCQALAQSVGCEVIADRDGVIVLRPIPTASGPITHTYVEGESCTMLTAERIIDASTAVNTVVYLGTGATVTNDDGSTSPGPAYLSIVEDTNPASPFNVMSNGQVPTFITDDLASTQAQVDAAAAAQLAIVESDTDGTSFTAVTDPGFDAGDVNLLVNTETRMNGIYVAATVTTPMDWTSAQQVTNRPSSVLVVPA